MRLRGTIERAELAIAGTTLGVTASLGIAAAPAGDEPLAGLLRRADEALYAAKAAGRNRVVRSTQLDEARGEANPRPAPQGEGGGGVRVAEEGASRPAGGVLLARRA